METLKHRAYSLTTPQPFIVHGLTFGTIERIDHRDRSNGLRIRSSNEGHLDLPDAVDISEQLEAPRVFVVEGVDQSLFFVFGGQTCFWVSTDLREADRLTLFRETHLEEYWTTTVLEQPNTLIFIYELGVLVIDERLRVLMHEGKLLNDVFVGIEVNTLKFVRDHEQEWLMPLAHESRA